MKYLAAVLLCLPGVYARAATYWVSPTGAAAWSNCGGSTPLNGASACSAQVAFADAKADDVINFRGGTYNLGPDGGGGYNGALNPANAGTAGHQITFQAYTGEIPVLSCTALSSPYSCRTIGIGDNGNISYITFDGFTLEGDNGGGPGSGTGSIIIGTSGNSPAPTGFIVQHMTVIGNPSVVPASYDDNFDGIRTNATTNSIIRNNVVHGFARSDGGGSNDNFGCIKVYGMNTLTIENNELYNCNTGISVKRPSDTLTIAYNFIHSLYEGIQFNINTGVSYGSNNWVIHDNVINLTTPSAAAGGFVGANDCCTYQNTGFVWYNNTIRDTVALCAYLSSSISLTWYNNICQAVARSDSGVWNTVNDDYSILEEDHNSYGSLNSFFIQLDRYGSNKRNYTTLASWQASTELIGGGHPGSGDIVGDPSFANGSGSFSLLSDFNLKSGSPAIGTGKGGVNMGAQICAVGPNANCSGSGVTSAPPSAPRGLTLR